MAAIIIGQSVPDFRRKLQRLEGEDSRNINKLLATAWKLNNNRELAWEGKEGKLMAALAGPRGERGVIGEDVEQVEEIFNDGHQEKINVLFARKQESGMPAGRDNESFSVRAHPAGSQIDEFG